MIHKEIDFESQQNLKHREDSMILIKLISNFDKNVKCKWLDKNFLVGVLFPISFFWDKVAIFLWTVKNIKILPCKWWRLHIKNISDILRC